MGGGDRKTDAIFGRYRITLHRVRFRCTRGDFLADDYCKARPGKWIIVVKCDQKIKKFPCLVTDDKETQQFDLNLDD